MIKRAWEKQSDIQAYMTALEIDAPITGRIPREDYLHPDDWRLLGEIQHALEPLYQMTMWTQGRNNAEGNGQLWGHLTGMEFVLEHLESLRALYIDETVDSVRDSASQLPPADIIPERAQRQSQRASRRAGRQAQPSLQFNEDALPRHTRATYTDPRSINNIANMLPDEKAYMRASVNNAWLKLNQYYTLLGDSPLFTAAVILHPGQGIQFLEKIWADQGQWVLNAKQDLKVYFDCWYQDQDDPDDPLSQSPSPGPQQQQQLVREDTPFQQWVNSRRPRRSETANELERYYRLEPQPVDDPVQWWVDHRTAFPRLSRFALDLLAIPAMAADCERAFSIAKLTVTSQRHSLQDCKIENIQLLKNWIKAGVFQVGNIRL